MMPANRFQVQLLARRILFIILGPDLCEKFKFPWCDSASKPLPKDWFVAVEAPPEPEPPAPPELPAPPPPAPPPLPPPPPPEPPEPPEPPPPAPPAPPPPPAPPAPPPPYVIPEPEPEPPAPPAPPVPAPPYVIPEPEPEPPAPPAPPVPAPPPYIPPPIYVQPWEPGPPHRPAPSPVGATIVTITGSTTDGTFEDWDVIWSDCWSSPSALNLWTSSSYRNKSMSAYLYSGAYFVGRTYLFFDLSSIPASASIESAIVTVIGKTNANTQVVIQEGTQHEPLIYADYNAYTGNYFSKVTWQKLVGASLNPNNLTFNAAGKIYVKSCFGSTAKFCIREYEHDYLNVAPTLSTHRNGMCFANYAVPAYKPYITITYKP